MKCFEAIYGIGVFDPDAGRFFFLSQTGEKLTEVEDIDVSVAYGDLLESLQGEGAIAKSRMRPRISQKQLTGYQLAARGSALLRAISPLEDPARSSEAEAPQGQP